MIRVAPRSAWGIWLNIVYESESSWIGYQKHDKVTEQISSWVPVPIVTSTFMKDVPSCLNRIVTTRTFKFFVREKL